MDAGKLKESSAKPAPMFLHVPEKPGFVTVPVWPFLTLRFDPAVVEPIDIVPAAIEDTQ